MNDLQPVPFKKPRPHAPRLSKPYVPGRHDSRFWTDQEDEIIRKYFPDGGYSAVAVRLPHRSPSSIYQRANKLGAERNGCNRTRNSINLPSDIDDILRRRWPELADKGATNAFAAEIGLPRWKLSKRARALGLTNAQRKEPPWTASEDQLMRQIPLHNPDKCAEIFAQNGFRRSPTAIVVRAKRLNLSRRATRETLSGTAAARILGLDNKTVTQWCVAGELKATRRPDRRLPQQGGSSWDIEPDDLKEFILANLAHIDIRKVEKVSFCHLLAFNRPTALGPPILPPGGPIVAREHNSTSPAQKGAPRPGANAHP